VYALSIYKNRIRLQTLTSGRSFKPQISQITQISMKQKIINPQRIYLRISSVIRTAEVLQYANFEGGLIMAA
jgi:hypothetical protein